jgi:hypothetical protein
VPAPDFDPGFAGMTENLISKLFAKPSELEKQKTNHESTKKEKARNKNKCLKSEKQNNITAKHEKTK